jgi:hypothetical protein
VNHHVLHALLELLQSKDMILQALSTYQILIKPDVMVLAFRINITTVQAINDLQRMEDTARIYGLGIVPGLSSRHLFHHSIYSNYPDIQLLLNPFDSD